MSILARKLLPLLAPITPQVAFLLMTDELEGHTEVYDLREAITERSLSIQRDHHHHSNT